MATFMGGLLQPISRPSSTTSGFSGGFTPTLSRYTSKQRSQTVFTSPLGLSDKDQATLFRKTLLGQ